MARCSSRIPSSRPRAARRPGGGWSTTTSGGRSSSGCRARRIFTAKRSVASIRAMGSGTCSVTVLVRSMDASRGVETSALRFAQRGSVDADGVALVTQPAEQRLDERLVAQEVRPLGVVQIGGDDRRPTAVPLLHQLEEDVRLLGSQVEVAHLVDDQYVAAPQPIEELAARAVRQGRVHLVEEVLRADEEAPMAILQRLQQEARGETRLADSRRADEDDVLGLGHEVEIGEAADLSLRDAGLALPGEGLDRPRLRHRGLLDPVRQHALLLVVPLGAEQTRDQLLVRQAVLV